jgi:hypothetical protein
VTTYHDNKAIGVISYDVSPVGAIWVKVGAKGKGAFISLDQAGGNTLFANDEQLSFFEVFDRTLSFGVIVFRSV